MILVAFAFIWAYQDGIERHLNIKSIRIKKHGRRAYSFFKYGLIELAKTLLNYSTTDKMKSHLKLLSCT